MRWRGTEWTEEGWTTGRDTTTVLSPLLTSSDTVPPDGGVEKMGREGREGRGTSGERQRSQRREVGNI